MGSVRTSARRVVLALVLGAGTAGNPSAARAQEHPTHSADPKARAADLYRQSAESYRKGDFATTIDLLRQAYALDPQPVLLYNLARAYEGTGDTDQAIDTYKKYLQADPNTKDRGAIEQRITTLERERDERIALQKQSEADRKRAEEEEAARAAAAAKQKKEAPPPHHRSAIPYIVGGIGIGGLGTGVVLGLMATSQHASARDEPQQLQAENEQNRAKTYATASTVAFIAGGALLAIGTTWWILDGGSSKASTQSARLGVSPGGLLFEGMFQ